MSEPSSDKPQRRIRYRGRNPRQFHEKYKEHQPEKYAGDIAKILANGRTPAGTHRPILLTEIMNILAPKPGEIAVDCTLGYGGHASEILAAIQPAGRLIGIDADPLELPKTEIRLRALGFPSESLSVHRSNYAGLSKVVFTESPQGADVILADLGLSSMQIDDPNRGFSFKSNGPLDMRLNPTRGSSAAELLSRWDESELAQILESNADEPQSRKMAELILASHHQSPITTTMSLANIIRENIGRSRPASDDTTNETIRRVFQAIRIAVNDEFGSLDAFLRQLPDCLKPGGRVAILSFHSGEDRRVKRSLKEGWQNGSYSVISEEIIRPSYAEQHANPRSSSAKLRYAIRA